MRDEKVDSAADIVQTLRRHFHQARLTAALALVGGVISQRDETLLGEMLGVQARSLLLHAAEGMGHNDRRVLSIRIKIGRLEEIGDDRSCPCFWPDK